MAVFANFINACRTITLTLGTFVIVVSALGCILVISLFTPLYSRGVLFVLNQISLPPTARLQHPPTAIVVLGGGLTNNRQNDIVINQYTQSRLQTAEQQYQHLELPIVVSGKESPWMRRWLQQQNIWWVIAEKNSFNTCENAKFTAQTINVRDVILVTDAYHMNRARRQFALNGIATLPNIAPLPQPADWYSLADNLKHSRRATYELLAFGRDVLRPQQDCKSP